MPAKKPVAATLDIVDQLMVRMKEKASTPEGRARMGAHTAQWMDEVQEREGAQYAAALDILAVYEKHFPVGKANLDAPEMIAMAIDHFKLGDEPKNGCPLYLEWTAEAFVGQKLLENLGDILTVHDILVKHGCTDAERKQYEWNDGDNNLFYIPTGDETKKVWCATGQTMRYMFIMDWNPELGVTQIHVRRYWDPIPEPCDKWGREEREEREEYLEKGFPLAVKNADWLREHFSDNLLDNRYIDRPDLQWWKEHKYDPQYGDCRDDGYVMSMRVASIGFGERARVDRAIYFMSDIKIAFFEIRCALDTLTNDPPVDSEVAG